MVKEKELKIFKKIDNGGYVYVCLAKDKTIKIGITKNPYVRLKQIETSSGKEIINWYVCECCANYKQIEQQLHKEYKNYRLKGEWFCCDYKKVIKSLNSNNKQDIHIINNDDMIKTLKLLKLILEVKYEEYTELKFDYDFNKWIPTEQDILFITNKIIENIEFNNKEFDGDFNEYLIKYLDIINKNKYSKEAKTSMQEYYLDFIDNIGYFDIAKKYFEDYQEYDFVKKVLGIKETMQNLLVDNILKDFIKKFYGTETMKKLN